MPRKKRVVPEVQVEQYERLVFGRAISFYRKLPIQFRSWIDVEDLSQMGLMWAWGALNPNNGRATWEPGRGKFTTFVQTVVDNCFVTYLETMYRSKRLPPGATVDIDKISLPSQHRMLEYNCSKELVQNLYVEASIELQSFLSNVLTGERRLVTHGRKFKRVRREFRRLAKQHQVTADDMRTVLGMRA